MISIKSVLGNFGSLMIHCPKCNSIQLVTEFGEQTCKYEKCDRHKYFVEFNFDTAKMLLAEVEKENKRLADAKPEKEVHPSAPRLQRVHNGFILVPQPPTDNPEFWYKN